MSGNLAMRLAVWLHTAAWTLFALGMAGFALFSPEARTHVVFLLVLAGTIVAALSAIATLRGRRWGAALSLVGGASVLAVWFATGSADLYRPIVAIELVLFALVLALSRRASVSAVAPSRCN